MGSHAGTRKDGGRSLAALYLQRVSAPIPYHSAWQMSVATPLADTVSCHLVVEPTKGMKHVVPGAIGLSFVS